MSGKPNRFPGGRIAVLGALVLALALLFVWGSASSVAAQTATETPTLVGTLPPNTEEPTEEATEEATVEATEAATTEAARPRARIGVGLVDSPDGVRLALISPNGPALKAGLRVGDIILTVDGQKISTADELRAILATKQPGDTLRLSIQRGTETLEVSLTLDAFPPTPTLAATFTPRPRNTTLPSRTPRPTSTRRPSVTPGGAPTRAGTVFTVSRYGYTFQALATGFVVTRVVANGAARRAGLLVGDVITAVDGVNVSATTLATISSRLVTARGTVALSVRRGTRTGIIRLSDAGVATPTAVIRAGTAYAVSRYGYTFQALTTGFVVTRIVANGAAQRAGLQVADIITGVDGVNVSANTLSSLVSRLVTARGTVVLSVRRGTLTGTIRMSDVVATPTRTPTPNTRASLGVSYEVVTEAVARARNLSVTNGAYILQVSPNSPAEAAGIKVGDVIIAVNGEVVDLKRTLPYRLTPYAVGDEITLTIVRGNERLEIKVALVTPRGVAMG